eukprot:451727-Pleurochrysis_carterae.AAC.1
MVAPIAVGEDVKPSRICTPLAQKAIEDLGLMTNANALHISGISKSDMNAFKFTVYGPSQLRSCILGKVSSGTVSIFSTSWRGGGTRRLLRPRPRTHSSNSSRAQF